MTRKKERLLTTLVARYFGDVMQQSTIRHVDRKAISSAAKNMAAEFARLTVDDLHGDGGFIRTTITENEMKHHVENMADLIGIQPHKLFTNTKGKNEIAMSRHVIIHMLRKHYGKVKAHEGIIGLMLNRSRSTILHSLKTSKILMQVKDPLFTSIYEVVRDYEFKEKND